MWSIVVMIVLGLWLMASSGVLGFEKTIADNGHIVGPLVVAFSVIALSECTRKVRYANVPLGVWLLVAPWILQYNNGVATVNDCATGAALLLLCVVKAKPEKRFGGGWRAIWRPNALHEREAGNPDRIRLRHP